MKRPLTAEELTRHRDFVAAALGTIPGLGQLYKGHYIEASGVILASFALAIWLGTLLCLAYAVGAVIAALGASVNWLALLFNPVTLYVGVLPALLFWAWVVCESFFEPDLRHPVATNSIAPERATPARGKLSDRVVAAETPVVPPRNQRRELQR